MVITGDLTQVDLPKKGSSGLYEALEVTSSIKQVSKYNLTAKMWLDIHSESNR